VRRIISPTLTYSKKIFVLIGSPRLHSVKEAIPVDPLGETHSPAEEFTNSSEVPRFSPNAQYRLWARLNPAPKTVIVVKSRVGPTLGKIERICRFFRKVNLTPKREYSWPLGLISTEEFPSDRDGDKHVMVLDVW
jgi:hypothetical protein